MRGYVTELLLNGWTNLDDIFCGGSSGFENDLDSQFGPISPLVKNVPKLLLCEGDTKNRWRDGQVCPDVRQGTVAPWARRLGCVLACYAQIGRGRTERVGERERTKGWKRKDKKVRERERTEGEGRKDGEKKRAESGIGVKRR
ncbi:hypothetical protein TNCV_1806171 [Trichonephila clavipes]|nr:hypothetical protein TNCV_1806171 [Trichonephila clavipes]